MKHPETNRQTDALIPAGTRITKQDAIRARYSTAWRAKEKIMVLVEPAAAATSGSTRPLIILPQVDLQKPV